MDRRNFLKAGSMALIGSLASGTALAIPPSLRGTLDKGAAQGAAVTSAMNYFGVSHEDLRKVLTAALEKGGDYGGH